MANTVAHYGVSERRACRVLGQCRATQRYNSRTEKDGKRLRNDVIRLASEYGRYGYKRITALLNQDGWRVNHKRVARLMEKLQRVERETYPSIVIISASTSDEARIRSLAMGVIDFISKPFNRAEVAARISNMLRVQPVLQPR